MKNNNIRNTYVFQLAVVCAVALVSYVYAGDCWRVKTQPCMEEKENGCQCYLWDIPGNPPVPVFMDGNVANVQGESKFKVPGRPGNKDTVGTTVTCKYDCLIYYLDEDGELMLDMKNSNFGLEWKVPSLEPNGVLYDS